jgi:hypothetical protein
VIFHGGVSIIAANSTPLLGEPSRGIRIIDTSLVGDDLKITADVPVDRSSTIEIATAWSVVKAEGASVDVIAPQSDRITFMARSDRASVDGYQRVEAIVRFKR